MHLVVDGLRGGGGLLLRNRDGLQRGRLEASKPEGGERQRARDLHELFDIAYGHLVKGGLAVLVQDRSTSTVLRLYLPKLRLTIRCQRPIILRELHEPDRSPFEHLAAERFALGLCDQLLSR